MTVILCNHDASLHFVATKQSFKFVLAPKKNVIYEKLCKSLRCSQMMLIEKDFQRAFIPLRDVGARHLSGIYPEEFFKEINHFDA